MTEKVQDTVEEIKKDEIAKTVEVVEKENQEEAKYYYVGQNLIISNFIVKL